MFSLSAENALGQPTAVTTGTVNRTYGYTAAGLPALRTIARTGGAVVQNFSYSYNTYSGNLHSRTDIVPGQDGPIPTSEAFQYDSLNRLRHAHMDHTLPDPPDSISFLPSYIYESISASYDSKGNILTRGAITNSYGNVSDPYAATASQWSDGAGLTEPYAPGRRLTMTSFDRPAVLSDTLECMTFASYEYDATGGKARASFPGIGIERRYLGGVFEKDIRVWEQWSDDMMDWQPRTETVQRLFLGGTAYDAPMVLVKEEDGDWTPYNIGRDVQGSITHVLTKDGALLERYIYDPSGGVERTDSTGTYVDTLVVVDTFGGSGGGWSRIVGSHGYTGHEVIAGVGIINANARLYDPATGRFLSPDPLVQDPASTQNFNRYSYCLNNPLKYTDESGMIFGVDDIAIAVIVGAVIGGYTGGVLANGGQYNPNRWNWKSSETYFYMIGGAAFGAFSGYVGAGISASGIPFANTVSISAASLTNSLGTYAYTLGETPVTVSLGAASYDFTNKEWGYLGKKGNSVLENAGYFFGRVVDCQRVSKDSCRTLLKQYFLCRAIAEYYGDTKDVSCSVIFDIAPYSIEAFAHVNKYAQQFVESVEPCAVEDLGYGKAFILQCIDKYNSKELDDFIKQMDRFCYYYHSKRNVRQKE